MTKTIEAMQPRAAPNGACYPPFRMSIEQYEKLIGSGVFTKRDKLQLINGWGRSFAEGIAEGGTA